ncbi:MAG: class I SAM-dependent methyltransferase [Nitriliruptoraceae bacterium]
MTDGQAEPPAEDRVLDAGTAGHGHAEPALPSAGRDGKDAALVQAMFDRVAPRYDFANALLSFGQDARWRRVTAASVAPAGSTILDVAAGPGNVARQMVTQGAQRVVALDLSFNMLAAGARSRPEGITWVNGDAMALPFADGSFDAVTISFGLRNVPDPVAALAEFARVTRPGGRLAVCEFAAPTAPRFRHLYQRYLVTALPKIAMVVSSSPSAYQYLADSILAWPDRRTVADWMVSVGYQHVQVKDLSGGIVAVHRAERC